MSNALPVDTASASKEGCPLDRYHSRPRQLARWLLESRDALRAKYQEVKAEVKRLKVRVSDVSKSRDNWRERAEASEQELREMKAEVERLTAHVQQHADCDLKKK